MADYTIQFAQLEDKKEIYYNILEYSFFPDMPLYEALDMKSPPTIDEWPALQTLEDNLTLKAVTSTGEIVGVAINVTPKDGIACGVPADIKRLFDYVDRDSNELLSKLEKSTIEIRVLGVHKHNRKQGISGKLIKESEKLAKTLGYKNIFAVATGAYMEAAFKKQNWKCLYRLLYKDYGDYQPKFKVPKDPNNSLTVYEKVF